MDDYNAKKQQNQESQQMEWKWSWHDEFLKWLCGYANMEGGTLYIGVNDDGYVVGIEDSKRMLESLPNKIYDKLGIIARPWGRGFLKVKAECKKVNAPLPVIDAKNGGVSISASGCEKYMSILRFGQYGQVGADGIWRNKEKVNKKKRR